MKLNKNLKKRQKSIKNNVNNFDPGFKQLLDEKIQQSSKLVMDPKER